MAGASASTSSNPESHQSFLARDVSHPTSARIIRILLFALAYLIAYVSAVSLSSRAGAPIWFPDSVILTALLVSSPRDWWIYIAASLPLRLAHSMPSGAPLWFLLAVFANDSLKALLSASLIRRLLPGRGVRFDSLRDFWIYLAITAFLVPALSAAGGAATWGVRGQVFWHTWRNWFLGNALVNIVLTPLFLELATDWRRFRKVNAGTGSRRL